MKRVFQFIESDEGDKLRIDTNLNLKEWIYLDEKTYGEYQYIVSPPAKLDNATVVDAVEEINERHLKVIEEFLQ